jgi:hypothetical protein
MDNPPLARCAAIVEDGSGTDPDALLEAVVNAQRSRGRRVHGLLMHFPFGREGRDGCGPQMVLHDIAGGTQYVVSQALGRESHSCRADPDGFARASAVLRNALDAQPDLVVVNRFGGLEANGGGFSAELLQLMLADIPLVTAVAARYQGAWQTFTGGSVLLPPRLDAVQAWLDQALAAPVGPLAAPAG